METDQKKKQKKIIITTVLVILLSALLFCVIQTIVLQRQMRDVKKQLIELSNYLTQQSVSSSDSEVVGKVTETVEQVISSEIISEVPSEGTAPEPDVKHKVYLTFDDGPSKQTEAILDILDEYGVKATFFVVGKEGEKVKERLQMIYERGHTIGMHSYSHDYADIYDSMEAFRTDFLKSKKYIYDAIGVETRYFRFPGGSSNRMGKIDMNEVVEFLKEQGVEYYDWNISSGDGGGNLMPARVIVDNCVKHISRYDTSIILMHDSAGKTTTVEALPQIIEEILAMEDTAILPITNSSNPVHHVIQPMEEKIDAEPESTQKPSEDADNQPES